MKRQTFGERLKFAIDHSGLTVHQTAEHAAIHPLALEAELKAQHPWPLDLEHADLASLCKVLGVSWAWLVEGEPLPRAQAAADRMRISGAGVLSPTDLDRVCDLLEAIG